MPDKPVRSAFIPLLFVGVVLISLVFALLVPVVRCGECAGAGFNTVPGHIVVNSNVYPLTRFPCKPCDSTGKVPLLNIWRRE